MAILVDTQTHVLVQGITGSVGSFQTKIMKEYGTNVLAGVTPGKGGQEVHGVPVYDLIHDAVKDHRIDAAISFVPARFGREAALEVIESKIPLLVLTTAGIPWQDLLAVVNRAKQDGLRLIGPDTPGIVSPGKCKLGVHPSRMISEGPVGILSKSGALSYEVCKVLTEAGIGQSTVVGIGGGPLWGVTQAEVLRMFEEDPETKVVVLLGEVGGKMELHAASYIQSHMTKPVVALIVGRSAPAGAQMGHAGAIVEGKETTAAHKIDRLRDAGAAIAYRPNDLPLILQELGVQL
jgi:succinyl-CoA synthetase alpha subunit